MLSRFFHLSLVSGQLYTIPVAIFYEGLVDQLKWVERALLEMALDVSGINNALWILETVAAEGKGWIEGEKRRREQRLSTLEHELAK